MYSDTTTDQMIDESFVEVTQAERDDALESALEQADAMSAGALLSRVETLIGLGYHVAFRHGKYSTDLTFFGDGESYVLTDCGWQSAVFRSATLDEMIGYCELIIQHHPMSAAA